MLDEWDINKLDRTNEYSFSEALKELLDKSNIVITSKKTGDSYIVCKIKESVKLKFYSTVLKGWRICVFVSPEEIFDKWYINNLNLMEKQVHEIL